MRAQEIREEIRRLSLEDQGIAAQSMSTQALLSALYDKCLDMEEVRQDFSEGRYSLLSAFDERGRLRVLIENFGTMMLTITEAQFNKGERSNGWGDIGREEMHDIVIKSLKTSLDNANQLRESKR